MDISVLYLDMCVKAKEIQKIRNGYFQWSDFHCFRKTINEINPENLDITWQKSKKVEYGPLYTWWIPTQSQLQGLLQGSPLGNIRNLTHVMEVRGEDFYDKFTSMEQIWLSIVMDSMHDKIWNFETKKWELI